MNQLEEKGLTDDKKQKTKKTFPSSICFLLKIDTEVKGLMMLSILNLYARDCFSCKILRAVLKKAKAFNFYLFPISYLFP